MKLTSAEELACDWHWTSTHENRITKIRQIQANALRRAFYLQSVARGAQILDEANQLDPRPCESKHEPMHP